MHPIGFDALMRPELVRGRVARLRAERLMLLVRYDHGAMPPGVYKAVRNLEIEITELLSRNLRA